MVFTILSKCGITEVSRVTCSWDIGSKTQQDDGVCGLHGGTSVLSSIIGTDGTS